MKSLYPLVAVILGGCCMAAVGRRIAASEHRAFPGRRPGLGRCALARFELQAAAPGSPCGPGGASGIALRPPHVLADAGGADDRPVRQPLWRGGGPEPPRIALRYRHAGQRPPSGRLPDRDHRQMASWLRAEWGPQRFGFDHGYGSLAGGCGPYDHRYKTGEFTRTWHRNGVLIEQQGHITDLIAREAVEWLKQRNEKPFFLYVPFTAIHVPIDEPEPWQQMNAHLTDPGQRLRAACTSHMDDAIGQVLAELERQQVRDRTLVIFLSDNGAHRPSDNQGGPYPGEYARVKVGNDNRPLRGHKTQVYEGGIRTPGVVCWPGHLKPCEIDTPLHAVDWMPTLCALAGVEPAQDLKWDGTNIWPILTQQARTLPARTLYSAAPSFRAKWSVTATGSWSSPSPAGRRGRPRNCSIWPQIPAKPRIWPPSSPASWPR